MIVPLGGLEHRGVRPDRPDDGIVVDPSRFVQVLLLLSVSAVAAIMAARGPTMAW
jgi:hypothetical protein